ncbi:MAG: hypothetical protein H6819_12085 [Phycisphaerales bacterium]|nr:hypothetical protein [Phycisphaerales bacterium]MCB9858687.1 hypothetical protein [Phycisphaerales bacterium]MCB9864457.1 hypothetical protein [Phycisphaerales bacterium]
MPKMKFSMALVLAGGILFSLGTAQAFHTSVTNTDPSPPPAGKPGACIIPGNGNCIIVTQTFCAIVGGSFQGPGSECPPEPKDAQGTSANPEPVGGKVGACIVPGNGYCAQVTELVCLLINGDYLGPGTDCPPEPKGD